MKEEDRCSPKIKETTNCKPSSSPQNRLKEIDLRGQERPSRKTGVNTINDKRLKNGANNSCNNSPASRGVKYDMDDEDTDSEEYSKPKSSPKYSDNKTSPDSVTNKTNNNVFQSAQLKNKVKSDSDSHPKAKLGKFESYSDDEKTVIVKEDTFTEAKTVKMELSPQNTPKKKDINKACDKKGGVCDKNKTVNKSPSTSKSSSPVQDSCTFSSDSHTIKQGKLLKMGQENTECTVPPSQQKTPLDIKPTLYKHDGMNLSNEQKNISNNTLNGYTNKHKLNDVLNKNIKTTEQEILSNNTPKQNQLITPQGKFFNHQGNPTQFNTKNNSIINKSGNQIKIQNKINNNQKFFPNNICHQIVKNHINTAVSQKCNKVDIQRLTCYQGSTDYQNRNSTEQQGNKNASFNDEERRIEEAQEALRSLSGNCIANRKLAKNVNEKPVFGNLIKKSSDVPSPATWKDVMVMNSSPAKSITEKLDVKILPQEMKREIADYQGDLTKFSGNKAIQMPENEIKKEPGMYYLII